MKLLAAVGVAFADAASPELIRHHKTVIAPDGAAALVQQATAQAQNQATPTERPKGYENMPLGCSLVTPGSSEISRLDYKMPNTGLDMCDPSTAQDASGVRFSVEIVQGQNLMTIKRLDQDAGWSFPASFVCCNSNEARINMLSVGPDMAHYPKDDAVGGVALHQGWTACSPEPLNDQKDYYGEKFIVKTESQGPDQPVKVRVDRVGNTGKNWEQNMRLACFSMDAKQTRADLMTEIKRKDLTAAVLAKRTTRLEAENDAKVQAAEEAANNPPPEKKEEVEITTTIPPPPLTLGATATMLSAVAAVMVSAVV